MITEIYEFWFFWSKNGRFVTHICFPKKKGPETPIFIVFFGCALSGPRCQKREILKSHPKKRKIWLITEKLIFGYFCCFFLASFFSCFFFFSFVFFVSFFVFVFFFGGFKGQVRWPEGPPHLALNPPSFFFCFFGCFFCFLFFFGGLRVRWGGPKGHLTWP